MGSTATPSASPASASARGMARWAVTSGAWSPTRPIRMPQGYCDILAGEGGRSMGSVVRAGAALVILCAAIDPSRGEGGSLHFQRVGAEGGPPSEVVTALHQDRTGFVWIGSRDGLTLYDGHDFTSF